MQGVCGCIVWWNVLFLDSRDIDQDDRSINGEDRNCFVHVVVCVRVVGSVHNEFEPNWCMVMGRGWGIMCGSGMGRELCVSNRK